MKTFDHATTKFPLRGKHVALGCGTCHGAIARTRTVPIALAGFDRCASCHTDPHAGQFTRGAVKRDCSACHNEHRFVPTTFSTTLHNSTRFPLNGGHEAVPCIKCHSTELVNGKRVRLFARDTVTACLACHQDPHAGKLARFAATGCVTCHTSSTWTEMRFPHSQTRFPLDGQHAQVACERCHAPITGTRDVAHWQFQGVATACSACHGVTVPPKSPRSAIEGKTKQ
jgi:hypothetical protein